MILGLKNLHGPLGLAAIKMVTLAEESRSKSFIRLGEADQRIAPKGRSGSSPLAMSHLVNSSALEASCCLILSCQCNFWKAPSYDQVRSNKDTNETTVKTLWPLLLRGSKSHACLRMKHSTCETFLNPTCINVKTCEDVQRSPPCWSRHMRCTRIASLEAFNP